MAQSHITSTPDNSFPIKKRARTIIQDQPISLEPVRQSNTQTPAPSRQSIPWSRLPIELLLMISEHLSIRDLCRLRMVSKVMTNLFSAPEIWRPALRELLTVIPLPRPDKKLGPEETIALATQLAKNAYLLQSPSYTPKLLAERNYKYRVLDQFLLPGGQRYFRRTQDGCSGIFDVLSDKEVFRFPRESDYSGHVMISTSYEEVLISFIVSLNSGGGDCAEVYKCNPRTGSYSLLWRSPTFRIGHSVSLTASVVAIVGYFNDRLTVMYKQFGTASHWLFDPIMNHRPGFCLIKLTSDGCFLLADNDGYSLFRIPENIQPNGTPLSIESLWKCKPYERQSSIPQIITWPSNNPQHPPSTFATWIGSQIAIHDLVMDEFSNGKPVSYVITLFDTTTDRPHYHNATRVNSSVALERSCAPKGGRNDYLAGIRFNFTSEKARERGNMRLDRPISERMVEFDIQLRKFVKNTAMITAVSYDEYSGRFLVTTINRGILSSLVLSHEL